MSWLLLTCLTATALGADAPAPLPGTGTELLRDRHFRQGCEVWAPEPGQHVHTAFLPGFETGAPPWGLCQWTSRFPLDGPPEPPTGGALRWANPGKTVVLGPGSPDQPDLTLAVNASREYDRRARRAGEPWVHLLAEQTFTCPVSFAQLTAVPFRLEVRIPRCERVDTPDYSPNLHAAQFQWYVTVQNLNHASPGYGDYYWFGISLFDDRHRVVPAATHGDPGTSKLIYCPPSDRYAAASLHDHGWVTFAGDLLPELLAGLHAAWEHGFLKDSRDLADYRLGCTNLGWEVPGLFDCEAQVRAMSLRVESAAAGLGLVR